MKIMIEIPNKSTAEKVIWFLDHLKDEGVAFQQEEQKKMDNRSDQYLRDNWMSLIMTHENPDIDDDAKLEQAQAGWEEVE